MFRKYLVYSFFLLSLTVNVSAMSKNQSIFDIPLQTLEGNTVSINQLRSGKPIYIKLWASWCQSCMEQMAHFQKTHEQLGSDIRVIGINIGVNESNEEIHKVIQKKSLSMPIVIDTTGNLAQELDLKGTPLHAIFDTQGHLVHVGHDVTDELNDKLSVIATGKLSLPKTTLSHSTTTGSSTAEESALHHLQSNHIVLFTATWCDWYFKETRPDMSNNCIAAQEITNDLAKKHNHKKWQVIASRLWTGEKELDAYIKKHSISIESTIDATNAGFHKYHITHFPSLVVFKNGKEQLRITDFSNKATVSTQLSKVIK